MPGLNQLELTDLVHTPEFGSRIVEVATYTADAFEAGFAIYRGESSGLVVVSGVQHPDTDYHEAIAAYMEGPGDKSREQRFAELLHMMDSDVDLEGILPHLDLGRLIVNEDATGIRTDLALVSHSHPMLHLGNRTPEDFLLPSGSDIRNFADHKAANPDIIEGVIATHTKLGGTALRFLRGSDGTQQLIEAAGTLGRKVTEEKLAALGISTAVITFNRNNGKVNKASLSNLGKLFVPPPGYTGS